MGLAGPRNKTKISNDPNNTQWAKSTTRFGHKILSSQGWTPGETLGIKGAAHSSHYSSASSSHIRVLLRDDNLGLGAKKGRSDTDVFGLDMFQGLLGRLNGKSEEQLEKEGVVRRDVLLKGVAAKRYGGTVFVRGGFLVGDKLIEDISAEEAERLAREKLAEDVVKEGPVFEEAGDRKRKRSGGESGKVEKSKKKRKSIGAEEAEGQEDTKVSKKEKRKKSKVEAHDNSPSQTSTQDEAASSPFKSEKKRLKAEKHARKEARRLKREERRLKKSKASSPSSSSSSSPEPPSTTPAHQALGARFAVRQRYIQQKRMAIMDQTALNEIFMIKTAV